MSDIEEKDEKMNEEESLPAGEGHTEESHLLHKTVHLSGMYENWFLDYASYVILERAVPDVNDGLKPVQRRILHAMKELDDGRYNKVANIIGHTMKYHPHGDASIGDALVQMGQKDLLIDTQGNWGNILTGDSAAAPRYIEARLSKLALEVVFNPKTTLWKLSYDGRNKEPQALPVKFPLLLAQGVEGIAVGLASKILPHNFNELIDASVRYLKGTGFELYPDFPTGGQVDVSKYSDGIKGGKVRIRAKINQIDKKTLVITEIPYGTNTSSLIDTIIAANDKGKIKIKKIDDNTAEQVEIRIHLTSGVSPDQTIDALYAFTSCEVSVSPNACVIHNGKPHFMGVSEMLQISADRTVSLLKSELEIRKMELLEQLMFSSLEKIFIEKRIYRDIEECRTWEAVLEAIENGLKPYRNKFYRDITKEDIIKLTEIRVKRISKFNTLKANELIKNLNIELEEVKNHLEHLVEYAINYYLQIKKKYGNAHKRKTEIRNFDTIEATMVAAATKKLYVNREEGFAGTVLRKDEYVCDCSDIDDIIVFREDGTFVVTKIADKVFVGENVIHIDVFKRNDDRTIYNVVYQDGKKGNIYVKRFPVKGITRDKEYSITRGTGGSRVLYFTANPNGEAEIIKVHLRPRPRMKKTSFEFDFSELAIKGRGAVGNILSKKAVRKVVKREEGVSTLGALDIWYDDTVRRLNTEERGVYLGAFKGEDKILTITGTGHYKVVGYDLSTHFDEDMIHIMKYDENLVISAVYIEGESRKPYLKRFLVENGDKKTNFIGDHTDTELLFVSFDRLPQLEIEYEENPRRKSNTELINASDFIAVKSYKAKGKRLTNSAFRNIRLLEPLPFDDEIEVTEGDHNEEQSTENGIDNVADKGKAEEGKKAEKIEAEEKKEKGKKIKEFDKKGKVEKKEKRDNVSKNSGKPSEETKSSVSSEKEKTNKKTREEEKQEGKSDGQISFNFE